MAIEHITDTISALETVLNSSDGTRVTTDKTDWLVEVSPAEVEQLYQTFSVLFQECLSSCIRELGQPLYTDVEDRERVDRWYPEALRLASWQRGDGYVFAALVHQDRETPIYLELGSISQAEINELSE